MEEYEHVTENKVNTKNHFLRALFLLMKLVINIGLFKKTTVWSLSLDLDTQ